MEGWIYIVSNEYMESCIKVGITGRHPIIRVKEFSGSGSMGLYIVEYAVYVTNYKKLEADVHVSLSTLYENDKEWFVCEPSEAWKEISKTIVRKAECYKIIDTFGEIIPTERIAEYLGPCSKCGLRIHESEPYYDHTDGRMKNKTLCGACWEASI